jgi:hypothetical protein
VALLVAMLLVAPAAEAHPVHSSLTEIARAADGGITLRIRVFADDFATAAARLAGVRPPADHAVSDAIAARYVATVVRVTDDGAAVELTLAGQRREGEVVWLELRGGGKRRGGSLRVLNTILFDLHADQVNVVQSNRRSGRHTLLFTRGDSLKTVAD